MSGTLPTRWRKSNSCDTNACVEVAVFEDEVLVRDSKDPEGPVLRFSRTEWEAFLAGVAAGEFSPLG
jgi:hypothetical protein